jgi:hypothetical protein
MSDAQHRTPRRPATLSADRAEYIVGDEDPERGSEAAHTSAWALMGVGDEDLGPEAIASLRHTVRTEGIDLVANMWSRSPEFTLPGALWRLYLLWEWYRRDPGAVRSRYEEGRSARVIPGLEHPVDIPDLDRVMGEVHALLTGERTDDDLAPVIGGAARVMRVLAAGDTLGATWIRDEDDPLAHPVTLRARALLRTADELGDAERHAEVGTLN